MNPAPRVLARAAAPVPGDRPHRLLPAVLALATAVSLGVITLVPDGATRMLAWPWSFAYGAALAGPALLLLYRAFEPARPLTLPSTAWQAAALGFATVVLLSALVSPYRAPAVLGAAPWLAATAVFFLAFDWLHAFPAFIDSRRAALWRWLRWGFTALAAVSMTGWLWEARHGTVSGLLANRNANPLGHSNYTAGLAVLMLPALAVAVFEGRKRIPVTGAGVTLVALAMLFSSGSRAGMIALVGLAAAGVAALPLQRATKLRLGVGALLIALTVVAAHPRTRAMLLPADPNLPPNLSNVQRHAMLVAGARMGADRPALGWGPGTTPLAFPRYRSGLDGGAENVLQLHSLPVQLWAELGFAGVLAAMTGVLLVARDRHRDLAAAATLGGYALFSLFDAQLDVPIFGFVVAVLAALVASPGSSAFEDAGLRLRQRAIGFVTLLALLAVAGVGHRERAPELNTAALRPEVGRRQPARAVALLTESLRRNPDQEIAHFNLGWLLVVSDPPAAERHFAAAAHLVPDKGGVYFGLGLARLNSGDRTGAARAMALEALNDPVFVLSPWWKTPQLAALQAETGAALAEAESRLAAVLPANTWAGRELRYVRALNGWISGQAAPAAVAAVANTTARRTFFAGKPAVARVRHLGTRTLRHERIGYPVLMRNLDLPAPVDLWVVRESAARDSDLAFLWPDKGWLPSPLLIALLDGKDPPRK